MDVALGDGLSQLLCVFSRWGAAELGELFPFSLDELHRRSSVLLLHSSSVSTGFGCRPSGPSETHIFLGFIIKDKIPFGAVAQQTLINTKKGTKF